MVSLLDDSDTTIDSVNGFHSFVHAGDAEKFRTLRAEQVDVATVAGRSTPCP